MLGAQRIRSLAVVVCGGLVCLVLSGCGGGPDLPPLAEVSGTVFLDDKPLERGTVQFIPDPSTLPKGATATPAVGGIDSSGRYTLSTAGVEGAIVGRHKVAVEARQEVDMSKGSWAPSLIPEKYNNPNQSGLSFEVKAGQSNTYDIKLVSRP